MTTELEPPSGIFYKGNFSPASHDLIGKIIDVWIAVANEKSAKASFDMMSAAQEPDLFMWANARRQAETKVDEALARLGEELRK